MGRGFVQGTHSGALPPTDVRMAIEDEPWRSMVWKMSYANMQPCPALDTGTPSWYNAPLSWEVYLLPQAPRPTTERTFNMATQETENLPVETQNQRDYILLDGSSSMRSKWWDMLAAIDRYVAGVQSANIDSWVKMSIFTTGALDAVARDQHVRDWTPLCTEGVGSEFRMTPLYDAIQTMAWKLRDEDPIRAHILIVTDGDDTGDEFTTREQCRAMLDWMRAKGWQVTFLGCDFNNEKQAKALGVTDSNAIGVQRSALTDAAAELARKRAAYGHAGAPMHWSEGEKHQFGGYLAYDSSSRA